jgi:alpha-glucosidase
MKKIAIYIASLLFVYITGISSLAAQSIYSNDSLVVFYPANYDSTQTQPSFAIQNEPVVQAGIPPNWPLAPSFYVNGSGQNCASLYCGSKVDFYGTGEVTGNLRRNNTNITLWNTDNYNYTKDSGNQLYQSHPWVLGVRPDGTAFGVIADNTWEMEINITDTTIAFTSQGPAFRVLVFQSSTPQGVIKELAALNAKISLPPLWALGYHQCRYSYMSDSEVRAVADSFRVNQLPCDVIWMDIDYMNQYEIFTFSPTGYPNPPALNSFLHTNKFKSVWMIDPGVKQLPGYFVYDQGTSGNYWVQNSSLSPYVGTVWPGNCVFPDFTMPATRNWWAGLYTGFMANGIDGVWNDMNEPSVFNGPGGTMPTSNIHRGGGGLPQASHLRYHNVFGRLMVEASRNGIMQANPTKRPFVLSRANYLGGQQYAATWTGDNASTSAFMQLSVPMILTLGLSGQPFSGADVTGYSGTCTPEIFGQWMALGTFYPFYRNHSEKGTNRREPWTFGPAMEQVARVALQRRYRLLPYIYTLMQESTVDGLPVMRPLFFADPTNASLRNQQQAFLLGDDLLVVPKWATSVTMPGGTWNSFSLVGVDTINDPYQPTVYLKAGSILPLGQIIQSTVDYSADSLTLVVSLDKNGQATGSVYSDSAEGYSYQNGQYLTRAFNIKPYGSDSLILTATVTGGQMLTSANRYRVGLVTTNGTAYTKWTSNNVIIIPKSFTAYGGIIRTIPGKIEAEDYDIGANGVTYYDTDSINQGGQFRKDGVDIETCSEGGYDVGWIAPGEWLTYTVNVQFPGTYTLQARIASYISGASFHIELDGVNISGAISLPNTGGAQNWQTVAVKTPYLTCGQKILRIVMDTNGFNLDYINFILLSQENCVNSTISYVGAIAAAGNTYQWQVDNGSGYTNMSYAGADKDTLVLSDAPGNAYGYTYRCAVTNNGFTYYSQEYTLQFANTWTGAVDTAWENTSNWSCAELPDSNSDVIINSGTPVTVNSDVSIRSLQANPSVQFTVSPGKQFNILH